jgi:hypothetical protein
LLRDFKREQSDFVTATGESRFQLQTKRDIRRAALGGFAELGIWRSTISILQHRVWRAFAADARVDLHPSDLIQGR